MRLQTTGNTKDIKEYVEELLKFHGKFELYKKLLNWNVPKFPVDGTTLKQHNCPSGKVMGIIINRLKEIWVKNEFKPTAEELLEYLPKIHADLNIIDGKQVKRAKTE